MQHSDGVRDLVTDVMPTAFPWVRFPPREDMQAFVVELAQPLEAPNSLGTPAPVTQLIHAWQRTAEIRAVPRLLSILRQNSTNDAITGWQGLETHAFEGRGSTCRFCQSEMVPL